MDMVAKEFNVYLVNLDPTVGADIKKSRPCVVLTPTKMNSVLGTVVIAPLTTTLRGYPSRVEMRFQNKFCEVSLDQIRAVDESRLISASLGRIPADDIAAIKTTLSEIFAL